MNSQLLEGRHRSTLEVAKHFAYEHLPENEIRDITMKFHDFAETLIRDTKEDSAELTTALRKLLEAKDCVVRTLPTAESPAKNTVTNPDAVDQKIQR